MAKRLINQYLFFLFLLFLFHFINNYITLSRNGFKLGCDVAQHLNRSADFYKEMKSSVDSGSLGIKSFLALFAQDKHFYWPKLYYFTTSAFNLIFGLNPFVSVMSNMLYFFIIILSTYLIGCYVSDEPTGALAALMVSFYPGIFKFSQVYSPDFPLTAMLVLGIFLLIKADTFASRPYSVACGIVFGLGMLTRMQFCVYIFGPLAYTVWRLFSQRNDKPRFISRLFNFMLCLLFAYIIFSVWWRNGTIDFFRKVITIAQDIVLSRPEIRIPNKLFLIPRGINFYFLSIFQYLGPFFFFVFLSASAVFFKSYAGKDKLTFLLWIIVPFLVLSMIKYKWSKYLFPTFPAFAVISAYGIRRQKSRRAIIAAVVAIGFISISALSFGYLSPAHPLYASCCPKTVLQSAFPDSDFYWCSAYPLGGESTEYGQTVIRRLCREIERHIPGNKPVNICLILEPSFFDNDVSELTSYLLKVHLSRYQINVYSNYEFADRDFDIDFDFLLVVQKGAGLAPDYTKISFLNFYDKGKTGLKQDEEKIINLKAELIEGYRLLRKERLLHRNNCDVFLMARRAT